MNFEKYTVILGFIFGVISAAYFISGKGKDHDKNKLSGLGAFVAVTLFYRYVKHNGKKSPYFNKQEEFSSLKGK